MYESLGGKIGKYSLISMYNYLYSIKSLLENRSYDNFKQDRIGYYSSSIRLKQLNLNENDKKYLFEQFFFSYKLMNNLRSFLHQNNNTKIALGQLAGIALYYASYSLVNCFNYIHSKNIQKYHSAANKVFNQYCKILAFPFNLAGKYIDGSKRAKFEIIYGKEEYPESFIYDNQALQNKNLEGFCYKSAIYSYLRGTHKFYWENSKQKENAKKDCSRLDLNDFRKKEARRIRDEFFETIPDANFLSCMYRLRGKVNYRDSIFSLYDVKPAEGLNLYAKAIQLPYIMLEILKYFSLDIESYFKCKLYQNRFHKEMLDDIIRKTSIYNLEFPRFQKNIFYGN